jgi:hypothetical protein
VTRRLLLIAVSLLLLLPLCAFITWKISIAKTLTTAEYEKLLKNSADVFEPKGLDKPDSVLKVFAVNVLHTPPFKRPFVGYGVYLGNGEVLTAAHVVGQWALFSNPRVLIAGQDLAARVIKDGSLKQIDLALLSVDQQRLPMSLRLRRNPLCEEPLTPGMEVIVVNVQKTIRSRIISPLLIAPEYRRRFYSLINEVEGSGSGVFDARRKCLVGIISRKITKFVYQRERNRIVVKADGYAGYFVPVPKIAEFLHSKS